MEELLGHKVDVAHSHGRDPAMSPDDAE
jgi:hypothetical protein